MGSSLLHGKRNTCPYNNQHPDVILSLVTSDAFSLYFGIYITAKHMFYTNL